MAVDPLRKTQTDGLRLQEAIDTEYRSARRENTWGRTQPQILARWRTALRAWTLAAEAALGSDQAALGRLRAAPPTAATQPGESADWLEIRNALAGKLAVVSALLGERAPGDGPGGATPPRSVWRKR